MVVGSFPRQLSKTILPGGYSARLGVESGGRAGNKVKTMRYLKYFALLGALLFIASVGSVKAQDYDNGYYADYDAYGPPPVCPYGYFSYYPYACAPYGYWGPNYFADGLFIGVGPWYGWGFGRGFRGHGGFGRGFHDGRGFGRGFNSRGFAGRGFNGRSGFANRGSFGNRGSFSRGFAGGNRGGFSRGGGNRGGGFSRGGGSFHGGGGGFHGGGGGSHGGGGHGGGGHGGGHR